MPSLLLTNTNRLLNKLDDLSILCRNIHPAIIAITETWLSNHISDNHIILSDNNFNFNYVIYRRDRNHRIGGGVLFYVRDDIHSFRLNYLESDTHEVLFVALRPKILPRPYSILILCLVYCPPSYSTEQKSDLSRYLITCVDNIQSKYPNAAYCMCGS